MKYELEPDNRNCPDETLLDDLKATAERLRKKSLTKDDYNVHGRFSTATMQNRFGSWNLALDRAGLQVSKRMFIPRNELLAEMRRVAAELGSQILTKEQFEEFGKFSAETIVRAFGSWAAGLKAADLEVSGSYRGRVSEEELFDNLACVWEALGRQPKRDEVEAPLSRHSGKTYAKRFGSWRKALEAFVSAANEDQRVTDDKPQQGQIAESEVSSHQHFKHKTKRDPSWRLRFMVNRKDRFTCKACGRSPVTHPGVVLHVDHIVPWSKGGETTLDNLQTLCEVCNIGKSDLSMFESGS